MQYETIIQRLTRLLTQCEEELVNGNPTYNRILTLNKRLDKLDNISILVVGDIIST